MTDQRNTVQYVIGKTDDGAAFIECRACGRRSFSANDITQRYCGFCHHFHDVRDTGKISDGYHTFDELYDHRAALWIALCRSYSRLTWISAVSETRRPHAEFTVNPVWRSRLHSDGSSLDGWFLLGLFEAPGRQVTYHLPDARWNECCFARTEERAPEFDGHTSADVLERLKAL